MNEYEDLLNQQDEERKQKLSSSVYSAADKVPDEEATLTRISQRSGIPTEALRLDRGAEAKRKIAVDSLEMLPSHAPRTADYLSDVENARVSHDDVEQLSTIEKVLRSAKNFAVKDIPNLATTYGARIGAGLQQGIGGLQRFMGEAIPNEEGYSIYRDDPELIAKGVARFQEGKQIEDLLAKEQPLKTYAGKIISSALQSIGYMVPGIALGMVSGPAAPVVSLGTMGALTGGQAYGEARDKNLLPRDAATSAAIQGGTEVATELLPFMALAKFFKPGKLTTKLAHYYLAEVPGEHIATAVQNTTGKYFDAPKDSPEARKQKAIDYFFSSEHAQDQIDTFFTTIVQGAMLSGTAAGVHKVASRDKVDKALTGLIDQKQQSQATVDFLTALGDGVTASKTFARLPENVQGLIHTIKQDGDVHDVFVPVEEIDRLYQSDLPPSIPVDAYTEAKATGGDVAIPLENFAMLAGTPEYAELSRVARTRLDRMSAKEAEEFDTGKEDRINELLAMAEETAPVDDVKYQDAYQKIYDDTYGQLLPIRGPEEADAGATIRAKGLATLAQRYGLDADALLQQFPVNVTRGPLPEALQKQLSFDQQQAQARLDTMLDRLRKGDTGPKEADIFGPSLSEFLISQGGLQDQGGELKARDAGKKKPFKKSLVQKEGMTFDRARELAAEAGYLPQDSTVSDFLDVLDGEMKGRPAYVPGSLNDNALNERESLRQFREYLDMAGVDLAQASNEEVRKVFGQEGGLFQSLPDTIEIDGVQRPTVNSNGQPLAQTEEGVKNFWRWFGDSKVVDKDGKPLVVYHGTTGEIADGEFKPSELGKKTAAKSAKKGFYFAKSPHSAVAYTFNTESTAENRTAIANEGREAVINAWVLDLNLIRSFVNKYDAYDLGELPDGDLIDNDKRPDGTKQQVELLEKFLDSRIASAWNDSLKEKWVNYVEEKATQSSLGESGSILPVYLKIVHPLNHEFGGSTTTTSINKVVTRAIKKNNDGVVAENIKDGGPITEHFVVFSPTQIKSVFNRGTFDPNDTNILYQGNGDKRAYFNPSTFELALLKKADSSSFIHEMGHYYYEVLSTLAAGENAPLQLTRDLEITRGWLGAKEGETLTVDQLEQFARGFEAYLYEGNAPSQELRGVFQRFKVWLKAVYASIKNLNVELSDDVRGVFDRLLATDAEIDAARQEANVKPVFATAEEAGMSEKVFAAYRSLAEQAHEEAKDRLDCAKLREVKRTHEAWWKEARAKMAAEVANEAKQEPVYQVLSLIYSGKLPDGTAVENHKLSGFELSKMYDKATLKAIRQKLGHVYVNEGGIHPDILAEEFGFSSGDEMVKRMMEAPKLRDFVKTETDRRMAEEHGAMNPAEIAEAAALAVHNEEQGKLLREELKAIRRKAREVSPFIRAAQAEGKDALSREKAEREYERRWMEAEKKLAVLTERGAKQAEIDALKDEIRANKERARAAKQMGKEAFKGIPPVGFFKEAARRHISGLVVAEIKPGLYSRAEAKAAKESAAAFNKGQFEEAAVAKQRQILNHYLYREAVAAKEEAEKVREFFRKMEGKRAQGILGKAGQEFQDTVNALLEQYEFRKVTNKELDYRAFLPGLIERMEESGRDTAPLMAILLSQKTNYRSMTLNELEDVADVARFVYHVAKTAESVRLGERRVDKGIIRDEVIGSLEANAKEAVATMERKDAHGLKKLLKFGRDFITSSFNADTVLFGLDGWERMGPVWRHVKGVVDDAVTHNLLPMQAKNGEAVEKLYSVYSGRELRRMFSQRFEVPEMKGSFTKEEILSLALNQGNEENRAAVLEGSDAVAVGLTQKKVDAVLARHLNERDWQFVQSVWDHVNSFWPEIAEKQRQRTGIIPKKVDASPVTTRFGTLPGGYFPLKYDTEKSVNAAQDSTEDFFTSVRNGRFSWAQTAHGHTIERVGSGGRPVLLSLSVLHNHLNQVITDLTLGDAVNYSAGVLNDAQIKRAFEQAGAVDARRYLDVWLTDVAMGERVAGDAVSRTFRRLRTGIAAKSMLFNVGVGLLQISGIVQTAGTIGTKNTLYGVQQLLAKPWHGENSVVNQIYALSPFMAKRDDTFQKDMMDFVSSIRNSKTRDFISHYGMYMIKRFQRIVDLATWLGAYHDGQERFKDEGDTENRALAYADRMVARAQGSGIFSDRSALERGSLGQDVRQNEFVRGLTTLLSYQIAKFNVAREKVGKTDFRDVGEVVELATDMTLLYVVDVMMTMLITGVWPGGDDDDESWLWKLGKNSAAAVLSAVPMARDITSSIQGFPGGGVLGTTGEAIARVWKQIDQGELDKALVKSVNNLGGILFKYPSAAMNRFGDALSRQLDGEDVALVEYFIYQDKGKK